MDPLPPLTHPHPFHPLLQYVTAILTPFRRYDAAEHEALCVLCKENGHHTGNNMGTTITQKHACVYTRPIVRAGHKMQLVSAAIEDEQTALGTVRRRAVGVRCARRPWNFEAPTAISKVNASAKATLKELQADDPHLRSTNHLLMRMHSSQHTHRRSSPAQNRRFHVIRMIWSWLGESSSTCVILAR